MKHKITLQDAVVRVCKEIKCDVEYRRSWQANIAMAIKDEFTWRSIFSFHSFCNRAASRFLDLLVRDVE